MRILVFLGAVAFLVVPQGIVFMIEDLSLASFFKAFNPSFLKEGAYYLILSFASINLLEGAQTLTYLKQNSNVLLVVLGYSSIIVAPLICLFSVALLLISREKIAANAEPDYWNSVGFLAYVFVMSAICTTVNAFVEA